VSSPAPVADSIASILLGAAKDLERAERELLANQRVLYVVEFASADGWRPLCGDSYIERVDAERISDRCELTTRVVEYAPRGAP
jgi:hypothetical protein